MLLIQVILLCGLAAGACGQALENKEFELLIVMPDVSPQEEVHLHRAVKLDPAQAIYITGFDPIFQYGLHVLLEVCNEPYSSEDVWSEDVMCKDQSYRICLLAQGQPVLHFPEGVGFKVGGDSGYSYLVLNVHYADIEPFRHGAVDRSGLKVLYTVDAPPRLAGQLMMKSNGSIEPGEKEYFEAAVVMDQDIVLHPFAFMVHTHELGEVVAAYRVRGDRWTEIGRRSPQVPQIYVPTNPVTIRKGDVVASRCTLFNFKDHIVHMGLMVEDEMCVFTMFYYVNGENIFSTSIVISKGPPDYQWSLDNRLDTSNVPAEASEIPPLPSEADNMHEAEHMMR